MNYLRILSLITFCFAVQGLSGQIHPKEGDTLNYTSILFSFPANAGAESYTIELSEASAGNQKMLFNTEANAHIISATGFGRSYFWRYESFDFSGRSLGWSDTFHFFINQHPKADPNLYRYRGKKKDRQGVEPGLLFMDYGRVAVNRGGKVFWYLPDFPFLQENELVRDLKLTPEGTITGLIDSVACEMDINGKILWIAPNDGKVSGESTENYHHDLKKLPNGNYMVLGITHAKRKIPDSSDSLEIEFGTIIEYDPQGNVVWDWKSSDHFSDAIIFGRKRRDGSYHVLTHMNAFSTDGKYVFAGFRDISTVIAIDKATKKITESYGGLEFATEPHGATGFFRRQHDALLLKDGNLAVLNNDSIMDPNIVSSVVIFSRVSEKNPVSHKAFEYKLDFDTLSNGKSAKMGNLQEMDNGNILVNMGALNRCIEISRTGELMWDMFMEKYDTVQNAWTKFPQYRVSYSPSLYPYVFRSRIVQNAVQKGTRNMEIKLFNVGESEDVYTIGFLDDTDTWTSEKENRTIRLLPGESGIVKLTTKEKGQLKLKLESGNSRLFEEINL